MCGLVDVLARDKVLMTRTERDAYQCLVDAYWLMRAPLPDDDERLAIGARCSRRTWAKLRPFLARFFTLEGGLWVHPAVERALDAQAAKAARAGGRTVSPELSAKRRAAARVRWDKHAAARSVQPPDANLHDLHDANDANADANRFHLDERETEKTGPLKAGFSQSLSPSQPRTDANHASDAKFASKRERQARKSPDPMLRLMAPIEGGKAAAEATAPPLPSAPAHFRDTWAAASAEMLRRLGLQRFHQWLSGLRVVAVESGRVTIEAPTAFDRARLGEDPQLGEQLADVLRNLDPTIEALDVVVRPRAAAA